MNRATRWPSVIGLGLIGAAVFGTGAGESREERVTLDQVPAAVKATILKESAGGKITEIERETKNGKIVYEAEFQLDGKETEIRIAPDGTLLGRETEGADEDDDDLTIDQVPEPARSALLRLAAGAKIVAAERETQHGVVTYEVKWVVDGVEHEAAVTADGTLLETEESIPPDRVPAAVRAAIERHFGRGAKVVVERKTIVVYEVEAKISGHEKELVIFPTGRVHEAEDEKHHCDMDKDRKHDAGEDDDHANDDDDD
jgi:uncharacterized membrane protein YkoI